MIHYPIKAMLVEHNPDQLLLTERALRRSIREIEIVPARNAQECLNRLLREDFSILVLDYSLPDMDGLGVIRKLREYGLDLPVVMVTGQGDEQLAVQAMKDGAYDYVVKKQGYLKMLPEILEKALERHSLESRLRSSEERYHRLAENANELIFTTDLDGRFTFFTSRVTSLLGYATEELQGRDFKELLTAESRERARKELQDYPGDQESKLLELDFLTRDGSPKAFELSLGRFVQGGRAAGFEVIGRDITQRKVLEKKILQRNKELSTLLTVTSSISHSLRIEEVAAIALEKICEFTGLNCGTIYTLRFTDSTLAQSAAFNLPQGLLRVLNSPGFWDEILASLFQSKIPLIHPDPGGVMGGKVLEKLVRPCQREAIQSFIVLPLFFKEKLFGFVFAGSFLQNSLAADQLEILNSICRQISAAIANAGLFNAVREAKTEWETTFDAMSELICIQDLTGKIIRVNRAMARRLNSEPRLLVNRKAEEVFKDPASPWCLHQEPEVYGRDRIVPVEFEDPQLNGTFEIAATPIYTLDGRLFAWLFAGKDITEQRELQNQLVQVERLKALGEMASGVAHDFNNVLAGILGKTQSILSQLENDGGMDLLTWKHDLKTIERQAVLGAQTVRRIQDFTRIRTDKKFNPVDLNQVVNSAVEIIKPVWKDQVEARGIKIDIRFIPGDISLVDGIDTELTEVILNIVSNSIDAMPEGGTLEILSENATSEGCDVVELKIKDTGIGMSDDVLQRVFDPFFSTKGPKGTGLGLSVAYGVITRHHGRILLDSTPGRGTTCTIRLPAAQQSERGLATRKLPVKSEKLRILVIDDEDVIREFMEEILAASGFEVDAAATGPEGIALFNENTYDLVFSDLGLPGMSGWEVAKTLKKAKPAIPIILLSGWGIQLDDERVKQNGIDLVLSKPCQIKEILEAVEEVLKHSE